MFRQRDPQPSLERHVHHRDVGGGDDVVEVAAAAAAAGCIPRDDRRVVRLRTSDQRQRHRHCQLRQSSRVIQTDGTEEQLGVVALVVVGGRLVLGTGW